MERSDPLPAIFLRSSSLLQYNHTNYKLFESPLHRKTSFVNSPPTYIVLQYSKDMNLFLNFLIKNLNSTTSYNKNAKKSTFSIYSEFFGVAILSLFVVLSCFCKGKIYKWCVSLLLFYSCELCLKRYPQK
jgi:hypothetical protein